MPRKARFCRRSVRAHRADSSNDLKCRVAGEDRRTQRQRLKITRQFEADLRKAFGTVGEDEDAITPDDALVALGRLTYLYTTDRNGQRHAHLPRPDPRQGKILNAIGLSFPLKPTAVKLAAQAEADFSESPIF